ncbi:hypothetical protein SMSP1_01798 [Sedimentisphaera salicampi]|nr:hypothetical protein SMSP1_01798 [Sedimentisphaera salicampi]
MKKYILYILVFAVLVFWAFWNHFTQQSRPYTKPSENYYKGVAANLQNSIMQNPRDWEGKGERMRKSVKELLRTQGRANPVIVMSYVKQCNPECDYWSVIVKYVDKAVDVFKISYEFGDQRVDLLTNDRLRPTYEFHKGMAHMVIPFRQFGIKPPPCAHEENYFAVLEKICIKLW